MKEAAVISSLVLPGACVYIDTLANKSRWVRDGKHPEKYILPL